MTLTLQIENFHVLDDGGPVSVLVPESGIRVGRRAGMDWVLPDASRYISGQHFEVGHDGASWWLTDLSTNGTFLQGHRHRLGAPHALSHGDRFQVGQYIIVAIFDMPQGQGALSPGSLPEHRMDRPVEEQAQDDPWALGGFSTAPVDPLPVGIAARQPDFADDFIEMPGPAAATPPVAVVQPFPSAPPPGPVPAAMDESAFMRGFCAGAGLAPGAMSTLAPEDFGRVLGEALRVTASQVMQALQDRAAARHFTRAGERTMRGAVDNNPLKFLPDAGQALDALFINPRAGFLTGAAGFDQALADLRRHQGSLFAALQPALIELLHDLDPDRIEAEAKGSPLTGNRKSRAWEVFVQRWDAKTANENGILDEFIRLFAAAYRKADETGPR
ncbi:type VI secretion system-associated FHA domain protein TagH [Paracoccus alkenifer]|uniref:FHA domain protein n=1 Tax=Paracoccus alkenifer TaxID=65735 RepID=A0A1H6J8S9_9RHOB|nr:type VI secretion system-associated FHA domain protein TagH [Paracoccus alkenifer]SEH58433.1 FHA domain protein [Paracoccus alkenifer]